MVIILSSLKVEEIKKFIFLEEYLIQELLKVQQEVITYSIHFVSALDEWHWCQLSRALKECFQKNFEKKNHPNTASITVQHE